MEIDSSAFNLLSTIGDVVRTFAQQASSSGLELVCRIDPVIPTCLLGDPIRIRQIITNLLGNAIKFTPTGLVSITVTLAPDDDEHASVLFEVTDTGIGIPEQHMGSIFNSFSQVDSTVSRKYGSTGLGLAICRLLAEMMGGATGVSSEEGKGSTFWFTARFERIAPAVAPFEEPGGDDDSGRFTAPNLAVTEGKSPAHILVADDNDVYQMIAKTALNRMGYRVDVVANGLEVLRALELVEYDIVLMDCLMPEMDGYVATAQIRSPDSPVLNHRVPIIAMTANAMKGDRERCLEAGMDDYLAKPIKMSAMADTVARWLAVKEPV